MSFCGCCKILTLLSLSHFSLILVIVLLLSKNHFYFPMQSFFYAHLELCKHLIHSILQGFTEGQKCFRGTDWGLHFYKETHKICKNATFLRIFSIFAFRCMVKWPLIGTEIAPVIAIKFSGLV